MDLGFFDPFGVSTRKLSDLGFRHRVLVGMPLIVGRTYRKLSSMFLHICHSSWVAYTKVIMVCS